MTDGNEWKRHARENLAVARERRLVGNREGASLRLLAAKFARRNAQAAQRTRV